MQGMLEMGERGVPGVPLGNPTPRSNAGKLSPYPPPPPAAGGGHFGAAPPPPPQQHPAWPETPPRGSRCPRDGGSLPSPFQRRKKKTFCSSGWGKKIKKKDPHNFYRRLKAGIKHTEKAGEGGKGGWGE